MNEYIHRKSLSANACGIMNISLHPPQNNIGRAKSVNVCIQQFTGIVAMEAEL